MSEPLARLAAALRAEGGLLASTVDPEAAAGLPASGPAVRAASGERTAAAPERYEALVEAIHEGYLLHYGGARLVSTEDPDLALLAGDHLYAVGLAELADLGDLDAVVALAGVISECARAHAEGRPAEALAAWETGAGAVAEGAGPVSVS